MTASITITLSPEILKALVAAKSMTVALGSAGRPGRASRAAPAKRTKSMRAPRVKASAEAKSGPYRAGSLPAKLVAWAGTRKRPFGVDEVMKKFRIKRSHASMLLSYVLKGGAVKRVGRGAYATT